MLAFGQRRRSGHARSALNRVSRAPPTTRRRKAANPRVVVTMLHSRASVGPRPDVTRTLSGFRLDLRCPWIQQDLEARGSASLLGQLPLDLF